MRNRLGWALLPLVFFQIYLNLTVLMFEFGPWPWPVDNKVELYTYLLSAHVSLAIGYLLALRRSWRIDPPQFGAVHKMFMVALIASVLLALPTSFSRTGVLLPDLAFGLQDPGEAYFIAVTRGHAGGEHVVIEYLRIFLAPVLALLLPTLVVYWSSITFLSRLVGSVAALWIVGLYVATGTNKGVADFVLVLPWLVLVRYYALGGTSLSLGRIAAAAVIPISLMLAFFTYGQLGRAGGAAIGSVFGPPVNIVADPDNWLTGSLPIEARIGLESLSRYLNAGYYALSRTFSLDFDSTFGVGNSIFLSRNFDAILGTHWTVTMTYPAKLETAEGWGVFALWHSIYPWLASDVGYAGTIIVVALVGWLLAASWVTAVKTRHPVAVSLFAYMCIVLYYFPANNQLMQSGESCVGFLGTLFWWTILLLIAKPRPRTRVLSDNPVTPLRGRTNAHQLA